MCILCILSTGLLADISSVTVLQHVSFWCAFIMLHMSNFDVLAWIVWWYSEQNHCMTLELIVVWRINCTGFDTARSFRGTLLLHHWTLYRSLPSRVETSLCAMPCSFAAGPPGPSFYDVEDTFWLQNLHLDLSTPERRHHRLHQKLVWCLVCTCRFC